MSARSIWQGTLTVQKHEIAIKLYAAVEDRHVHFHLLHKRDRTRVQQRMVDPETEKPVAPDETLRAFEASPGVPLERRFYCPRDGREVGADDIVRGHELDEDSYIIITDNELEAIEPRKTREIELREFVDLSEVAPAYMERGYFLTPGKGATKAYRLLAEVMEKTRRAGIATFVMRDREYLVAIFAQNGILCAETLRFHDEVRDPQTIGLPGRVTPPPQRVSAFERSISALGKKVINHERLADPDAEKLKALIARKKKKGKDLIQVNERKQEVGDQKETDVDLLDTIRRSLRHVEKRHNDSSHRSKSSGNGRPIRRKQHRKSK